jgi:hypothetical protein
LDLVKLKLHVLWYIYLNVRFAFQIYCEIKL